MDGSQAGYTGVKNDWLQLVTPPMEATHYSVQILTENSRK